jgi:hypothetical protein
MWAGVSVYDDADHALVIARRLGLGAFLGQLQIPVDGSVRIEKTGTDVHHFTLWGRATDLLRSIESMQGAQT